MEIRRATVTLLWSQASPLSNIFTPSIAARWASGGPLSCKSIPNAVCRRNFNTSYPYKAIKSTATTSAPITNNKATIDLKETSESLGWGAPPLKGGQSVLGRPPRKERDERELNGGSTSESILRELELHSSNKVDLSRMQTPFSQGMSLMDDVNKISGMPKPVRIPIDLKPSTGRMVEINGNIDLGRGFRMLEQSCGRNRVRADFTKQRFHERGGLKRKRLRRERWRRRFMEGFRATVGRVKQLKNQGW